MPTPFAICRDGEPVPESLGGAVAAIGNFDGVHRGHRHLLQLALNSGRPAAAVTFEPHPRTFFQPDRPLFRLTPEAVKLAIFARLGLTGAFVRRFDGALAALTAEDFVNLLARELQLSGVVIGHDFHFGRGREGNPERMAKLCRERGLDCLVAPAVVEGTQPVSSSAIRAALEAGDVAAAGRLLGYRWFVRSEVRHGDKRGRVLGYPTANMALGSDCRLRHGIYAVRASAGGRIVDGVASFGRRPTFDNGAPLLEVHLFDFAGDLYGQVLDVEFVGWIRGEERFDGIEALIARMDLDSIEAKRMLAEDQVVSMIA
ncbi:bifunctional riboflavin kinase/FAD synthetase [Microvirga arsenatis]|uniref:Riboflavin biosynthesis protein n=1 Tax=Microvirga arsenatis TaxID=2692265 RepID=A0ABW9Z3H5_9HYPH|nr:bifunctional riboflavin kinase/FAD synthetase [Microvirga arsenatis]NBJ13729.1 bifunctional riboflavin kinase/FAD synthetase [Microvirga arsenatis]NBJ26260.1 bifunctional riboflavin kinase/FAD synthetase [Microvirga arsenatis]